MNCKPLYGEKNTQSCYLNTSELADKGCLSIQLSVIKRSLDVLFESLVFFSSLIVFDKHAIRRAGALV